MPRLSNGQWDKIEDLWHNSPEVSITRIAKRFGVMAQTVSNHAQNADWRYPRKAVGVRTERVVPVKPLTEVVTDDPPPATVTESYEAPPVHEFGSQTSSELAVAEGDLQAMYDEEKARRIAAEVRTRALEVQVSQWKPYAEVDVYDTLEDVIEMVGKGRLIELAAQSMAAINNVRRAQHFPDFILSDEEQEVKVVEIAQRFLDKKYLAEDENPHRTRVIKMVTKAGNVVQVVAENQVNNMAGSRSDWYAVYTAKGHKIAINSRTKATFCGSLNCNRDSKLDDRGKPMWQSYCSEGHMRWCEENKKNAATALSLISSGQPDVLEQSRNLTSA